jgi:ribosomal-protein-alanine N-acetyltransferase
MDDMRFPDIFPILETERLILREISHDDSQAIFKNFSDPEVARWFFDQPLTDIEQAEKFIDSFNNEFKNGEGLTWALVIKKEDTCVGTCGYGEIEHGARGEIGFDLAKEQWGKGLMSEALAPIIEYGFDVLGLSMGFQLDKISEDSHYFFISSCKLPGSQP